VASDVNTFYLMKGKMSLAKKMVLARMEYLMRF
jgi:hypothetical protein